MTYSLTASQIPSSSIGGSLGFKSRVDLVFEKDPDGRSYLSRQYADYPFHVCRPHYFDREPSGMATLYLQSCSGGLFEDDNLLCSLAVKPGAAAHLTSQASTIVHSSRRNRSANYKALICAERNSFVEYLPDPIILFPQARLDTSIDVVLDPTAIVIISDAFILHDPDNANRRPGLLATSICARTFEGKLLIADRSRIFADEFELDTPGVIGFWICYGSLMVLNRFKPADELCSRLREVLANSSEIYAGFSSLPNEAGVWARFLARDAISLRSAMLRAWKESRKLLTGYEPDLRRK